MSSAAQTLRRRLSKQKVLLVPGAYNALVARVFEQAGFEAVYTGGYAAAAANYALPDIGLMTQSEMAAHVERISRAVSVPLIADADTGFGDLTNVSRTIREYERAGAAAVQIKDQVFPKRCGHMEGKKVIARDEMVKKVQAALGARQDSETLIIARTDAIAVTGLADAIERLKVYENAGADVLFPDAPRSEDELRQISESLELPLIANISEHGKTPLLDRKTIGELGYAIALFPSTSLFAAAYSALEVASALKNDGTSEAILDRIMVLNELNELLGLSSWQEEEDAAAR